MSNLNERVAPAVTKELKSVTPVAQPGWVKWSYARLTDEQRKIAASTDPNARYRFEMEREVDVELVNFWATYEATEVSEEGTYTWVGTVSLTTPNDWDPEDYDNPAMPYYVYCPELYAYIQAEGAWSLKKVKLDRFLMDYFSKQQELYP
jgi:hypothetical protein